MRIIAIASGMLGSIIGIISAISTIIAVGANPAYSDRLRAG
ncbi:MAG: hypothetical protein ABI406_06015 [Ktedonobacteraceae bacterium]